MATTPALLLRAAGLVLVLSGLSGVAVVWAAGSIADMARTVGRDAEPSVALALGMTATLAGLNAAAIGDSLTDAGAASGTSRAFRDGVVEIEGDMLDAARNITYGEAEAEPLRRLQLAITSYIEAVVESRYIGGTDALITARRVEWASRVNRDFAAPAALELADANASVLEARWAAYQARWWIGALAGFGALAMLVALLVAVQVWLAGRVRRLVNLPLALATAVGVAVGLWFGSTAISAHATLRGAKQDAYDSLYVLFEAKSAVSVLRADLSLWLLDPAERADAQRRIDAAGDALIGTHDPASARTLAGQLQSALAQAGAKPPKFSGLLGTEMANVTFGLPEQEAATDAVLRLVAAEAMMQSVQVQSASDRAAAIARGLSQAPAGGIAAFAAEQDALDRTIAVNQAEFDQDTATAIHLAGSVVPVTLASLLAIVALSSGGLWLRLREYR